MDDAAQLELEQAEGDAENIALKEKAPVGYAVGVIRRERVNAFERVLWRACHHTAYVRASEMEEELEDPDSGERVQKAVFIVFYKGDRLKNIIDKV